MPKNLRLFISFFLLSALSVDAQTLFSEDFNSLAGTTSVPNGWVLRNMDGRPGASNVSTLTGNSTNAWTFPGVFNNLMRSAVSVSWTNPVGAVDRWLISPSITLPATGNYYLIYDAQSLGNATYPEAYELRLSNGDTTRSSFLTSAPLFSTTGENLSLTTRGFSLASYAGTTLRFAFRNISNDMVAMLVDNIRITVPAFEEVAMVQHSVPALAFTNSPVTIAGSFRNLGLNAVSTGNLNYRVNGGATTSQPYSGSVASFATDLFTFTSAFTPNNAGSYSIDIWMSGVNGTSVGSDTLTATLSVVDPAPPVQSNLVIYEHFTNASCPPCATANPLFQALLLANNTEVTSVKHHTSWPGVDPMYSFNTGDPTSRVNYYGITGVPAVRLGNMLSSNPASITQANLDDNIANLPSNWYYNINTTINGSTLVVTGSVRGKSTQANTDNKLWLYLVEDPINYATAPGTNGEREFPSVLRKILPTSSGINCGNGSQNTTINASYPLSPTFVRDNLYLLAFVQANGTKEANKGVKVKLGFSTNSHNILPTIPSCLNDTVIVPVNNGTLNGVANAALRMTYNADSLTYVGSSNLNPAFNGMVVNGGNGVVTLDWNTSTNQNIAAGNMVNLRFRVNGSSALTWDTLIYPSEFSDVNFNVIPQNFQSGGVTNRTLRYQVQRQICQGQNLQMGGQTFSTGGNYQVVLTGTGSDCDTLVKLALSVLPTQTSISATTCSNQPYSFDGQNLNVSGVYRDTLINISGCDSVITLNLTVQPAYSQTISVVSCPGTSYNFGNQVLTTSGTYTSTFSTVGGCDSVVQLNLAYADSIQIVAQGGSTGFCPGGSLRIGASSNIQQGTYRWKLNGNNIGTANADTLLVNQAGTYQAELVLTPTCTLYSNILNVSVLNCNQITGDLRYDNTNLTPLAGIPVELKSLLGNVVAADTTDSSGNYSMSGYANGNYILDAQIGYNSGGINSTDALLVNRYFTSLISLTPLRARAGDVNGTQITNSADALLISRRITNLLTSFSVGNFVNNKPTINAQGNPLSVSTRALSTGDVNGSFIVQPSAPTLVLDTIYENGNVGTVVVRFTNPGSGVFDRGIVWSSSPNPTISSNKSVAGKGGFGFTHSFGGMTAGSPYYVRAYARTSAGVYYSPERSFITVLWVRCPGTPSVTDVDGNLYHTVQIGTQCWTQSNLKVSKYRNGDNIPTGLSNSDWQNIIAGSYAIYNNDPVNDGLYGKLYNHFAVMDTRGLCPTGWHVPTDGEWTALETFLGGSSVAGGSLKSTSIQPTPGGWASPNTGATNYSGFSALPGGLRDYYGGFINIGDAGYWWSMSNSGLNAWSRVMNTSSGDVTRLSLFRTGGFSVRCLKD